MHRFKCGNWAMATTAAPVEVTTGTAIKTMLQIATPSTRQIQLISWGFTLDAAPATTGEGVIELMQSDVAATVTAHSASGVQPLDPNSPASLMTLGTSATGFTASAEGTTTASRSFDTVKVAGVSNGAWPTSYSYQWMPDERPIVAVSKFLRVRATFSAAVNALVWVVWDE
jgi:hypothetical protein